MARWGWIAAVPLMLSLVLSPGLLAAASDDGHGPDLHVAAGGELLFVRPPDFGLAVHPGQLLVTSYIPACDWTFDYCLYWLGQDLAGTNFESAGIRIERRDDLTTAEACLWEPPRGWVALEPTVRMGDGFSVSSFDVGEAAVGHYAEGTVFRLSLDTACFELETRIAARQFHNYPEGTIREFTDDAQAALEMRLAQVLHGVRLVDRPELELFPLPAR